MMAPAYLKGPVVHIASRQGCTGKAAHLSRSDAMKIVNAIPMLHGLPYLCKHCAHWHNTSKRTKARKLELQTFKRKGDQ